MMKELLKITEIATLSISGYFLNYRSQIFIAQIEDLNEDFDKISPPYLLYFLRNKPLKSVTVGSGRSIILKDSARPKIVIKIYFNVFRSFFLCFRAVWMSSRLSIYDCYIIGTPNNYINHKKPAPKLISNCIKIW